MPLRGETLKLIVTNGRVIFSDVEVPDQHAVPVYGFPCVVGRRLRSASRRSDREVVCEYACRGRTHVAGWAANMLFICVYRMHDVRVVSGMHMMQPRTLVALSKARPSCH